MSPAAQVSLENILAAAGVDAAKAKKSLAELDGRFSGVHAKIPEWALEPWVNAHFYGKGVPLAIAIARAWEADLTDARTTKKPAKAEK